MKLVFQDDLACEDSQVSRANSEMLEKMDTTADWDLKESKVNEEIRFLWMTGDQISLVNAEFPEIREHQEMKEIWDFQATLDSLD